MLKKTIAYTDFNGVETTGDFYFNLTKAEAVLLEIGRDGGKTLSDSLQEMIDSKQNATLVREFKEIIRLSYGERSTDGKRFEKGSEQELAKRFESTGAYHTLLFELVTDANAAAHFINGIVPDELGTDPVALVNQTQNQKTARQLSEERLSDYNRKQQKPATTSQIVPDLPTSTEPVQAPAESLKPLAKTLPVTDIDWDTTAKAPTVADYSLEAEAVLTNTNPEIVANPEPTTRREALNFQQQYTQQNPAQ